jgi:hypothetical protein
MLNSWFAKILYFNFSYTQYVHISTKVTRSTTSLPKSTLADIGEAEIMLIADPLTRQSSTTPAKESIEGELVINWQLILL